MNDQEHINQIRESIKVISARVFDISVRLKNAPNEGDNNYQVDSKIFDISAELHQHAKSNSDFEVIKKTAEQLRIYTSSISDNMRGSMSDAIKIELNMLEQSNEILLSIIAATNSITNEDLENLLSGRLFATKREIELDQRYSKLLLSVNLLEKNLDSYNVKMSESIQNVLYESHNAATKVSEEYEKVMASLKNKNDQIDELRHYLSSKVLHGAHSDTATSRFRTANICVISAFAIIAFSIWFIYSSLEVVLNNRENYLFMASRFFLVLFLTLPITLLMRESGRFRATGNRYKQTALDLQTLDPYTAQLSKESQDQLKVMLAPQMFFAYENNNSSEANSVYLQDSMTKIIEAYGKNKASS